MQVYHNPRVLFGVMFVQTKVFLDLFTDDSQMKVFYNY